MPLVWVVLPGTIPGGGNPEVVARVPGIGCFIAVRGGGTGFRLSRGLSLSRLDRFRGSHVVVESKAKQIDVEQGLTSHSTRYIGHFWDDILQI